ncbi:MAG: hypothetical protein HY461_02560 [Parcubacteria group bacterium]|nr:hypothetical protein [Parcubacteria group bacterium]
MDSILQAQNGILENFIHKPFMKNKAKGVVFGDVSKIKAKKFSWGSVKPLLRNWGDELIE